MLIPKSGDLICSVLLVLQEKQNQPEDGCSPRLFWMTLSLSSFKFSTFFCFLSEELKKKRKLIYENLFL